MEWLPVNKDFILPYYLNGKYIPMNDKPCSQLFKSTVINPDGKVTPCCWVTSKENIWGDLAKELFRISGIMKNISTPEVFLII